MRLQITTEQIQRFRQQLKMAGVREIGGVLMGEHVSDDTFRLADFSVQHAGGTASCFMRTPADHTAFFDAFFARTGHQYTRFNYLGEWHSHPSFPAIPSTTDIAAMQEIVEDAGHGTNFALLLVVNLNWRRQLCLSASAFQANRGPVEIELVFDEGAPDLGWRHRLRLFRPRRIQLRLPA